MNNIEENNKERIIVLGNVNSSLLTKREFIAAGIMAQFSDSARSGEDIDELADLAVKMTDALIRRVSQNK